MPSEVPRTGVLIVDDHELTAMALSAFIRSRGYSASYAMSGMDALELAESKPPSYAIVDIRMPGMNGVDLARALRKRFQHIVLISMTGAEAGTQLYEDMCAACDHMMRKPLDLDRLISLLAKGPAT